jgi:hypothetical protein
MRSTHPEGKVQKAIFGYLVSQNFLAIRVNSGGVTQEYIFWLCHRGDNYL